MSLIHAIIVAFKFVSHILAPRKNSDQSDPLCSPDVCTDYSSSEGVGHTSCIKLAHRARVLRVDRHLLRETMNSLYNLRFENKCTVNSTCRASQARSLNTNVVTVRQFVAETRASATRACARCRDIARRKERKASKNAAKTRSVQRRWDVAI